MRNDSYETCEEEMLGILEDSDSGSKIEDESRNTGEVCTGEATSRTSTSDEHLIHFQNIAETFCSNSSAMKETEKPSNLDPIELQPSHDDDNHHSSLQDAAAQEYCYLEALNEKDNHQRSLQDDAVQESCHVLQGQDDDDDDENYIPDSESEDDIFENSTSGVRENQSLLFKDLNINENSIDLSDLHSSMKLPEPQRDPQPTSTGLVKNSSNLGKIKRPCPYCPIMQSRLTRHITMRHKDLPEVQSIMKLPVKKRRIQFDLLKKRGIFEYNKKMIAQNEPIQVERRNAERAINDRRIKLCTKCRGFIDATWFFKHKKLCGGKTEDDTMPDAIPLELLETENFEEDSFNKLICRFRGDAVGVLCRTDTVILQLGEHLFKKIQKRKGKEKETRHSVMQNMRLLGALSTRFKKLCMDEQGKEVQTCDMFVRENFEILEKAVREITTGEDGSIKHGSRIYIANVIKRTCKVLRGRYLIKCDDKMAKEIENFEVVFKLHYSAMFGSAEAAIVQNRNENLRDPIKLPMEDDVLRIKRYTLKVIEDLMKTRNDGWDITCYLQLRNAVVSRLTFYNARRGGEPCRILVEEWRKASEDKYIDGGRIESLSEQEKEMIKNKKVIYQGGKGSKLVPVIVTSDLVGAVNILADDSIRQLCGISTANKFLFPSKSGSQNHVSGYYACKQLACEAGVTRKLTATGMRHRAATMHANLGKSTNENQEFYQHMGHEKEVNESVYQCPPALREIIRVGPYLESIDNSAIQNAKEREKGTEVNTKEMNSTELSQTDESQVLNSAEIIAQSQSDVESVHDEPPVKKTRKRHGRWPSDVEKHLREFFKDAIEDVSTCGNRGSLPSNEEKRRFLGYHPNFLSDVTDAEKLKIVHAKLFNERAKIRKKYGKQMQTFVE